MIIPNLEYHQGLCAWLDHKKREENPYISKEYSLLVCKWIKSWDEGWDYANLNYGVRKYGKV